GRTQVERGGGGGVHPSVPGKTIRPMPTTTDETDRRPFHVLLLRHGQTDANATGVLQGHQPTPLNSLGLLQAERLAQRVARYSPRPTALLSSDLRRAVQTAGALSAACGLAPVL